MNKKIKIAIIGAVIFLFAGVVIVSANPSAFLNSITTSGTLATTSISYMTPGTATSSVSFDSYSTTGYTTGATGRPLVTNKATLLIQFNASSTSSTLLTNIEYSQDGVDWYQNAGGFVDAYSTSTKPYDISQVAQYQFNFASSTAGLPVAGANSATTTRAVPVSVPTRYARAIFTCKIGGTNCGVWAQFVPIREQQ